MHDDLAYTTDSDVAGAMGAVGNAAGAEIKLEVSEDRVAVEIDGICGEVTGGQARQVREGLAEYAISLIRDTSRSRRLESQTVGLDYGPDEIGRVARPGLQRLGRF